MKQATNLTGNLGEQLARQYLEKQGLVHLHSNWRMGKKEVDLIMHKEGVLHFIEVKTQSSGSLTTPDRRVNAAKLSNMRQVASGFLQTHPGWRFIQFDIVAIVLEQGKEADFFWIEDLT
jgi:putative endonuclease